MTSLLRSPRRFVSLQMTASCIARYNVEQIRSSCRETYLCYRTGPIDGECVLTPWNARSWGCPGRKKKTGIWVHPKGKTLASVSSTSYLGVCFIETLEWEAHNNRITSKANSTLGFLWRNLKACPPKLRENAYFSLVRSSLEYSSSSSSSLRNRV